MPPSANSLAAFWKFLLRGGNALKPLRKDRWDPRQFWDKDPERPGKTYAPKAGYLDADLQQFDPLAFGISPREAACMDPQQRLLLESAWEAFDDAGLPQECLSGSATGVFVGGFCLDHLIHQSQPSNRHLINAQSPAGATMTVLSNRVSHVFNLKGPSLTLDTACSSSLVAVHYACQSLRLGECEMALAGGVNVMSRPDFPILMSKGHFLSPHGECHPFDESAAGYARGEGAGLFLLKPLEKALADGDPIHAVICGSGANQDGRTDGISLPNSEAQETLIREVYRRSGVAPAEVDYVEAHGTGTQAGDPAEARALQENFGEGREPAKKLLLGSVKSNIGHLEAAAGVAGLLKAIGVLKFRQVPKNLHFQTPNPKIPFEASCLKVVTETTALPAPEEKPTVYAGVNSFGYGGTNAHVLLSSAPTAAVVEAPESAGLRVIPFSARSESALRDLAGKLAFQIGQGIPGSLDDLAHTAAFHRSHLDWRGAALAGTLEELRDQWIAASTGQPREGLTLGDRPAEKGEGLVFVYTGMGPQWWAMGQELIRTESLVAETIEEIDALFHPLAGWSLREAMMADEASSRMARTELAQPANFALQVALTRWWASRGIRPAAVIGHSVGEVVSAYVAGLYTLEEAVRVSFHRSRLQQTAAGQGAMLAVGLPEEEAAKRLEDFPGVSLAAVNSFSAVTLSGDSDQLKRLAEDLEKQDVFQKFLRVEVAYHSPQMDPLRDELLSSLAGLTPREARIPLYSTAHGKIVPTAEWNAEYWWRNVRQPVYFAAAVRALLEDGYADFLEVGPHPVLGNSIKECAAHLERKVRCFASLRRKEPEPVRLLGTVGELYVAGYQPDWTKLAPGTGRFLPGPQYPWQRQAHWLESERSRMERLGLPGSVYLNRTVTGPAACWEVEINRNYFPFLFDHGVQDQTVFAGMGYVEAALSLSRHVHETPAVVLENVSFEKVLIVEPAKLQYLLTEFDPEQGRFRIFSRVEGEENSVQRQCRGRLVPLSHPEPMTMDLAALRAGCPEPVTLEAFYENLGLRGLHYGPAFRPTTEVFVGEQSFFVAIDARTVEGEGTHPLHPTIFDAAIQPILFRAGGDHLFVPFSMEQFQYFSRPGADCYAFGKLTRQTDSIIEAHVWLMDAGGGVHAHARHVSLQRIEIADQPAAPPIFYRPEWTPAALERPADFPGAEVLVLDAGPDRLAEKLAEGIPGSVLVRWEAAHSGGFRKEAAAGILASHAERNRVVVLWGANEGGRSEMAAVSERAIGLLQAIREDRPEGMDVTFVTRGARSVLGGDLTDLASSSLGALGLVAQNESEVLRCRSVDLSPGEDEQAVSWLTSELAAGSRGDIAYREGKRWELGLHPRAAEEPERMMEQSVEEPLELHLGGKGRLDSVGFAPAERPAPGEGEIELRVHAVSLNYKDVLKVEGHLHPIALENTFWGSDLGMECAGVVVRCGPNSRFAPGDRVVTILPRGFRSYATVPETFAVKIPGNLGMEAAGIPVTYLTAFRGLVDLANLQPGERVLIHHATGGLGLAAVNIAQWIGAEIFATAGSEEKRAHLRTLGIQHVYSSRDLDFGQGIRQATGQEGVDVVIGAQTGRALHGSLGLLRAGGRYIEVGKKDIAEDNSLPLRAFNRNVVFASLDIDRLALERPALIRATLEKILEHFASGDFRLGAVRTFPAREIREAFREMARSRHMGKVLVDFSQGEVEVSCRPRIEAVVKADGCYVITGGTSGFGLATARWLAAQGAGKVVLVSRSGSQVAGLDEAVREIESGGTCVDVVAADVTDPELVCELIEQAGRGGFPLRGVVHAAMVLDDALMADLTEDQFRRVFQPKVAGALNLVQAVRGRAGLDFLVLYSSISALIGNRGQTNYVAANSLLDALAHQLQADGVPAVSINWGALAESGVVARDHRLGAVLASAGITGLANTEALAALADVLRMGQPQIGVFRMDWAKWHEGHANLADDPRFRELRIRSRESGGADVASQIRQALAGESREQRLRALEAHLQDVLAHILKMSRDTVPLNRKLNEMGVDSLMVLELGLGIRERIGINFTAMEFLKGPNLQQLAVLAEGRLWSK